MAWSLLYVVTSNLDEWIEGLCNTSHLLPDTNIQHQLEDKSYSIIIDQATTTKQTHSNHELEMVQLRRSWGGCGQRKCRKKNTSCKEAETSYVFGFLKHFVSGDVNFGTRKNYSHWTSDEVEKLLNGVEEHGVGSWALIKRTYFRTLPRTPEHLKDKWRGLCRACGLQVGSKQKVKAQPSTREFLKGFTYKIREMARKNDA